MQGNMVSIELFEAFLKCPLKSFFLANERGGKCTNPVTVWVREQEEAYRSFGMRYLKNEGVLTIERAFEGDGLSASIVAAKSRSKRSGPRIQYTPIRFVFGNRTTAHDRAMAAFEAI